VGRAAAAIGKPGQFAPRPWRRIWIDE